MKKEYIASSLIVLVLAMGVGFWYSSRAGEGESIVNETLSSRLVRERIEPPSSGVEQTTPPSVKVTTETTGSTSKISFTSNSVGYLGCSMTINAVEGYISEGGKVIWGELGDFGGGTISAWAGLLPTSRMYWMGFDALLKKYPNPNAVWMELCISIKKGGTESDTYENALIMRQEVLRRIPNAVVYVSAQPGYTAGHVCGIAGADGPTKMQEIADKLVANGLAKKGPVLGPLATGQTADPCHANASGKSTMGKQMVDFFDR